MVFVQKRSGDPINMSVASETAVCHMLSQLSCFCWKETAEELGTDGTHLRYWPCQKIHHSLTQVAEKSFTLQFPLAQEFKVFFAKVFVACIVSHQLKFIDQLISNGRKSTLINPYPANCFDCFGLPAVFLRCLLPSQLIWKYIYIYYIQYVNIIYIHWIAVCYSSSRPSRNYPQNLTATFDVSEMHLQWPIKTPQEPLGGGVKGRKDTNLGRSGKFG